MQNAETSADVAGSSEVMSDHPPATGADVSAQEVTMAQRKGQHERSEGDTVVDEQPEQPEPEGTEPTTPDVEPEIARPEGHPDEIDRPGPAPDVEDEPESGEQSEDETEAPSAEDEVEGAEADEEEEEAPRKKKRPYVFTPFQATKYVNELLAAANVTKADGTPKTVNSPMMYIYARADRFQIRRSPVDIERKQRGELPKGVKPRWEVWPLADFDAWAKEYVQNAKEGITAAQRRKSQREAGEAGEGETAGDDQAEQDVAAQLKASLAAVSEAE